MACCWRQQLSSDCCCLGRTTDLLLVLLLVKLDDADGAEVFCHLLDGDIRRQAGHVHHVRVR